MPFPACSRGGRWEGTAQEFQSLNHRVCNPLRFYTLKPLSPTRSFFLWGIWVVGNNGKTEPEQHFCFLSKQRPLLWCRCKCMLSLHPRRLADLPFRFFFLSFFQFCIDTVRRFTKNPACLQKAGKSFFQNSWEPKRQSRITTHSCAPIVSRGYFYQLLSQQSTWCVFLLASTPDAFMDAAQSRHDLWCVLGPQSERSPQDSGQCGIQHIQLFFFFSFFSYFVWKVLWVAFVAEAFSHNFTHEPLRAWSSEHQQSWWSWKY